MSVIHFMPFFPYVSINAIGFSVAFFTISVAFSFLVRFKNRVEGNDNLPLFYSIRQMSKRNQVILIIAFIFSCYLDRFLFRYFYLLYSIALKWQVVVLVLAFSKYGDYFFRFLRGCRGVFTLEEIEKVSYVFAEVKSIYCIGCKSLKNVQLYIEDVTDINAYAMGKETIVITRGALHALSDEQIRGIFAHEFSHIKNGDTLISVILMYANGFGAIVALLFKLLNLIFIKLLNNSLLYRITKGLLDFVYMVLTFYIQALLMIHSRLCEYEADHTAYTTGYGDDLINALYFISRLDLPQRLPTFKERLNSTHPNIFLRIARLENNTPFTESEPPERLKALE